MQQFRLREAPDRLKSLCRTPKKKLFNGPTLYNENIASLLSLSMKNFKLIQFKFLKNVRLCKRIS